MSRSTISTGVKGKISDSHRFFIHAVGDTRPVEEIIARGFDDKESAIDSRSYIFSDFELHCDARRRLDAVW